MSNEFISSLNDIFIELEFSNTTRNKTQCISAISHYKLYQFTLIPAMVIIIIFAVFEKRRHFLLSVFGGRPGCIYPMDVLTRSSRISYACAFGATVILLERIIFEQLFAFDYRGPLYLKTLVSIVSVVIYGLAFYPIFACLAVGSMFAYGLGTLYVWMFTTIHFYKIFECDIKLETRLILLARGFPNLACWIYLSISLPGRFFIAAKKRSFFRKSDVDFDHSLSLKEIRDSYQGHAVKKLLVRPDPQPPPPDGILGKVKSILLNIVHDWLYHWKKDFLYSSRILSVMIVGIQIIYIVTFELISAFYPLITVFLEIILYTISQIGYYPVEGELSATASTRQLLYIAYYFLYALQVCLVVSASVAFVIGLVLILHMLSSYRRNLQALYRGDNSHIPPLTERSNASHMVGFLRYAGYQVGYIAWAYIIQFLLLLLLSFTLAVVITLVKEGYDDWLINRVLQLWPVLLITLALNIVQLLVSKFCFIQNRGEVMAMDNRRALFVFSYFMFFFNVFLGLVSCLLRIVKSILIGALFLGRLDHSTLTRRFQFFDPGFAAYVGFLHVENAHTHPCVLVFVRLMMLNLEKHSHLDSEEGSGQSLQDHTEMTRRKRMGARFNWHVAYTLLNNPSLRMYRKGFLQGLQKDLKEGKRRQISDKLADDIHTYDQKKNGDAYPISNDIRL